MTLEEYIKKEPQDKLESERNYKALVSLCICFDVDWIDEPYEECLAKVNMSLLMLENELESMSDRKEANKLFKTRTAKLPER